jgi:hypothetical protein
MQVYFQLIRQLVLILLHVSAANRSHLQAATIVEDMYSVIYRLSNTNDKLFRNISVIP